MRRQSPPFAFASYVAALDAEEAAATSWLHVVDRVHRTYLDSGAESTARAPSHSLENSCSMSLAPSRTHSTPMCSGTMGEQ